LVFVVLTIQRAVQSFWRSFAGLSCQASGTRRGPLELGPQHFEVNSGGEPARSSPLLDSPANRSATSKDRVGRPAAPARQVIRRALLAPARLGITAPPLAGDQQLQTFQLEAPLEQPRGLRLALRRQVSKLGVRRSNPLPDRLEEGRERQTRAETDASAKLALLFRPPGLQAALQSANRLIDRSECASFALDLLRGEAGGRREPIHRLRP
jgi:hypothetical protein